MSKKDKGGLKKTVIKNVLVFFAVLIFSVYAFVTFPFLNKIYPNVYVAGLYLGDLTKDKAVKELENIKLNERVTLVIKEKKKDLLVNDLLIRKDNQNTIERIYNYTNTGNIFFDFINKLNLIVRPKNFGLETRIDEQKAEEALIIFASEFGEKPLYPSGQIKNGEVSIDAGKNGVEVDLKGAISDISRVISYNTQEEVTISLKEINVKLTQDDLKKYKELLQKIVGKKIELKIDFDSYVLNDSDLATILSNSGKLDEQKTKSKIAEIARKINRNPQDSVFIVENGKVTEFTPSVDGVTVNEDKLIADIESSLLKLIVEENTKQVVINIPVIKSSPKIKTEDINNLGIKTLIGKGISYFKGSIPNRIHNINLAQSKFKGILVPPNKTFSFNEILGDVSAYTGYKAAYVIKDGKTVLGDGGGVCQVSTTLFRAVLSAGLPIVERKPHSYRVGYYEQGFAPGLDATVFYPTTDFKFKNDTPNHILIQPVIDLKNYNLNFEIYGTSDGRTATTTKPVITSSIAPAPDLYVDDPTIPAGTIKQIEHRAYGARVVFDYIVTRNGETINTQKFVSNYRPWQAVYLRGVGQ